MDAAAGCGERWANVSNGGMESELLGSSRCSGSRKCGGGYGGYCARLPPD